MLLVPYVLISTGGYTPVQAGLAMLPLPILLTAASPIMGSLATRIGPQIPLTVGPIVVGAGMLLAGRVDADAQYWTSVFPMMVMMAAGMSIAVAPLTATVLGAVEQEHTGIASGFNSQVARIGGAAGVGPRPGVNLGHRAVHFFQGCGHFGIHVG
jgi:MFS family permease